MPNEPVEKVLLTSENDLSGGHLTLPRYKIVEEVAFCEVIFFYISPKNLLGDFFYSLNAELRGGENAPAFFTSLSRDRLGSIVNSVVF